MRLRVVDIPNRGKTTTPTDDRLHDDIDFSLQKADILFTASGFELRRLSAVSPHTLGRHEVLWLNHPQPKRNIHWDTLSEQQVMQQDIFWQEVEKYARQEQQHSKENLRAYMYHGFILPEWKNGSEAPVIWRGMQSQIRLHMHLAETLPPDTVHEWLNSQLDAQSISSIARFLNLAGESMIQLHTPALQNFGERFEYHQPLLGNPEVPTYTRTLFAFPDLGTAIRASIQLKKQVSEYWFIMAQAVVEHSPQLFAGQMFSMMQSAIPNFVYILPCEEDQKLTHRTKPEVWVAPFAVVGAPEMLTQGGVHLRRGR